MSALPAARDRTAEKSVWHSRQTLPCVRVITSFMPLYTLASFYTPSTKLALPAVVSRRHLRCGMPSYRITLRTLFRPTCAVALPGGWKKTSLPRAAQKERRKKLLVRSLKEEKEKKMMFTDRTTHIDEIADEDDNVDWAVSTDPAAVQARRDAISGTAFGKPSELIIWEQ